jgi:hypothetical protein
MPGGIPLTPPGPGGWNDPGVVGVVVAVVAAVPPVSDDVSLLRLSRKQPPMKSRRASAATPTMICVLLSTFVSL